MTSQCDIARTWAERWVGLRAWRVYLEDIDITVSDREHPRRAGTCWQFERRLIVYRQPRTIDMLATLLHELAHAATVGDHHGQRWQFIYAEAATEVTGIQVVSGVDGKFEVINEAVRDAMRAWWRDSGNAFAERLITRRAATP